MKPCSTRPVSSAAEKRVCSDGASLVATATTRKPSLFSRSVRAWIAGARESAMAVAPSGVRTWVQTASTSSTAPLQIRSGAAPGLRTTTDSRRRVKSKGISSSLA